VVFAWSILLIIAVAAGMTGLARPAQANIRIASSNTEVTLTSKLSAAVALGTTTAALGTAARPVARYVVQYGDTLSGIAARFSVRGGWATLYAANRSLIGPDPDVIHPGAVLVLPGQRPLTRYMVVSGDTLAGIAAALAVRGGWPTLYAANRHVIGPDPNVIRPGAVLAIPRTPTPGSARPGPAPRQYRTPPPAGPAGSGHRPGPRTGAPTDTGMPSWLKTMLLGAGLLIGAAFLAEPVLAVRRRRRLAAARTPRVAPAGSGQGPGVGRPRAGKARIMVADYDRLVVTRCQRDGTVYVLRPPGADPREILRVARLVLPEGSYRELAGQLGMLASWPIVVADYDRLVVTRCQRDGTVYVLRPPGADPREILRVARLVLPEGSYGELADQLGIPAGLPMG
jgi:LysM repeat protein